jgi:hypothetical protein
MSGYSTDCRFFTDTDDLTNIHWYRVPKDRPCLPVASFVSNSDWDNINGPRSSIFKGQPPTLQGEQWAERPFDRNPPRPGEAFSGHFCGTPAQWAGDLRSDRPADIGTYGCCNPARLGAYDCSWSDAFDNWGPCP